jgi:hypothetical protein
MDRFHSHCLSLVCQSSPEMLLVQQERPDESVLPIAAAVAKSRKRQSTNPWPQQLLGGSGRLPLAINQGRRLWTSFVNPSVQTVLAIVKRSGATGKECPTTRFSRTKKSTRGHGTPTLDPSVQAVLVIAERSGARERQCPTPFFTNTKKKTRGSGPHPLRHHGARDRARAQSATANALARARSLIISRREDD